MTPALADQLTNLAFNVVSLIVIPVVVWFLSQLMRQGIAHIKDQRVRNFVQVLVNRATQVIPATDARGNRARYEYVATELHQKFGFLPASEIEALIEAAVLASKSQFDWLTAVSEPLAPAAVNTTTLVGALDIDAITAVLTKDLQGLVAPALAQQVENIVTAALHPAPAPTAVPVDSQGVPVVQVALLDAEAPAQP